MYGDDSTSTGSNIPLNWLEETMSSEYTITIGPRIGPGPEDAKEARALNRIVRWRDNCIGYECDPRQVEEPVAECGMEGSKSVVTPGIKQTFKDLEQSEDLPQRLHTAFRGAAARANYLAADRLDAQFSCKEICRWMSKPSMMSWLALKRLCRYLEGLPRHGLPLLAAGSGCH